MIKPAVQRYEVWAGIALSLLLLSATLDGYVAAGLALGLLVAAAAVVILRAL